MGASGSTEGMPSEIQVCCKREEVCGVYRMVNNVIEIELKKNKNEESADLGISFDTNNCITSVRESTIAHKAGVSKHIGKKLLNRDEAESDINSIDKLRIESSDKMFSNKLPVWSNGNSYLYSTKEGKWMLTDSEEGIARSSGHAMTSQHCGKPPNQLDWMVAENKIWSVDKSFAVWELTPKPEFKVGQLVEFKPKISSTPDQYRPGLISAVRQPSELQGSDTQYEIDINSQRYNVHASCIRAHSAYRQQDGVMVC
eukprot:TRINITY_DN2545_c2_g1_i1.p1 TRINITY_DN2545_c2_g1~~TRINITY_DN2545_c2_g1_i1.p1  ORF type:complete len:256 (+),score=44.22 TRINITY_DN2545_c2_g1_i1:39-806(+)